MLSQQAAQIPSPMGSTTLPSPETGRSRIASCILCVHWHVPQFLNQPARRSVRVRPPSLTRRRTLRCYDSMTDLAGPANQKPTHCAIPHVCTREQHREHKGLSSEQPRAGYCGLTRTQCKDEEARQLQRSSCPTTAELAIHISRGPAWAPTSCPPKHVAFTLTATRNREHVPFHINRTSHRTKHLLECCTTRPPKQNRRQTARYHRSHVSHVIAHKRDLQTVCGWYNAVDSRHRRDSPLYSPTPAGVASLAGAGVTYFPQASAQRTLTLERRRPREPVRCT